MENKIINTIYDFNDNNIKIIKDLIDQGKIKDMNSLNKVIDPLSINRNKDGTIIKELSVYSNEFNNYEYESTQETNKLLNSILPHDCKLSKKPNDIDILINLIDDKISLITKMI